MYHTAFLMYQKITKSKKHSFFNRILPFALQVVLIASKPEILAQGCFNVVTLSTKSA